MIEFEMAKLFVIVVDELSDFKLEQQRAVNSEEPAVPASFVIRVNHAAFRQFLELRLQPVAFVQLQDQAV